MKIYCVNTGEVKEYQEPVKTVKEIAEDLNIKTEYPLLGAMVNNKVRNLSYRVYETAQVEFIDYNHIAGQQMYVRTLELILFKAVRTIFPSYTLKIMHSISGGKYCELDLTDQYITLKSITNTYAITEQEVEAISNEMKRLIAADLPIEKEYLPTQQVVQIYEQEGLHDKAKTVKYRGSLFTPIYTLDGLSNYYYGYALPSTGYVPTFRLLPYESGFLLQAPAKKNPTTLPRVTYQKKLYDIIQEHKDWVSLMKVPYVGDLNERIENHDARRLIAFAEVLHGRKIMEIADNIYKRGNIRMVLISGPSSSGKTSFSKQLSLALQALGYQTMSISVDDYFVERDETPLDENGEKDYESIEAVDLKLFNAQMQDLLAGKDVVIPEFDFVHGVKRYDRSPVHIDKDTIIILEGIHCLNPRLTEQITDESIKYKVFVSALTQISLDAQNPIATTDNRLIRRMLRDSKYRGISASETLKRWSSVRKGEERNIFPYQENADVMFNSALICELSAMKIEADRLLSDIKESDPMYSESIRLRKFLSYFTAIKESDVPYTSTLREFIGGSLWFKKEKHY